MSRQQLPPSAAYTLAHTAQCKLQLAANRPDRNLRFVLGHAFTLDNLMLRIVEIENQSAKSAFQEGNKKSSRDHGPDDHDRTAGLEAFDCSQTQPTPAEAEPSGRGRKVSFQENHARPSSNTGPKASSSGRKRSPIPVFDDVGSDETTSSDDYDDPETIKYQYHDEAGDGDGEPEQAQPPPRRRPVHDAYSDEEDEALELADDELDDPAGDGDGEADEDRNDLGLRRFDSATSQPPLKVRSASSSSSSSDENEPVSPPQLPTQVDVKQLVQGDKDAELTSLYESVRRCGCHGDRDMVGGTPAGMWDVPVEKAGGRRLAVIALAA